MLVRTVRAVARRPALTLLLVGLLSALLLSGFARVETARIQDLFLPTGLSEKDALDVIAREFDDGQAIFLMAEQADPLAPQALRDVDALASRLADAPAARDVASFATLVRAELGGVPLADAADPDVRDATRRVADARPDALARFTADDAALVSATFDASLAPEEVVDRVDAAIADSWRGESRVIAAGLPYADVEARAEGAGDVALLMPIALGVMLVILAVLFRSFRDVAFPFVTALAAVALAYASLPWLGVPLSPLLFGVGPLVLGLGIDYAIHFVSSLRARPRGETLAERLVAGSGEVARPVLFTAVTTIIGFGSFLLSPIPQIRYWGVLIGAGALAAFLLTFTLLPALYGVFGRPDRAKRDPLDRLSAALPRIAGRPRMTVAIVGAITLALGVAATGIVVETSLDTSLDPDSAYARDQAAFDARFGGSARLQVLVRDADASMGAVDALAQNLDALPQVAGAQVDRAGDLARIQAVYARDAEAETVDAARALVDESGLEATLTGAGVIQQVSQRLIVESLLLSNGFALLAVLVVLVILFRSLAWSVLAFAPLVAVLVWQLGFQALGGVPLNPVTGVTTAMVIGVGVDYSLHVAERARRGLAQGDSPAEAARSALRGVGPPVLAAAATTMGAFVVLSQSNNAQLREFGLVASVVVLAAFVLSLLLVPALVALRRGAPSRDASTR